MKILKRLCTVLVVFLLAMILLDGAVAGVVEENMLSDGRYTSTPVPVTFSLNQSFEIVLPAAFNFENHKGYLSANSLFNVNIHRLNESAILYVNVTGSTENNGTYFNMSTTGDDRNHDVQYVMGLTDSNSEHIESIDVNENNIISPNEKTIYNSSADPNNINKYIHLRTILKESELSLTGTYSDTLTFEVHIVEPDGS